MRAQSSHVQATECGMWHEVVLLAVCLCNEHITQYMWVAQRRKGNCLLYQAELGHWSGGWLAVLARHAAG